MATPLNRGTSGVVLPKNVSDEILGNAVADSAVMRLAKQVTLPGPGLSIQVVTGEPQAAWVNEAAAKPVSNATASTKVMTPYKLAVIETFTDEFRRDVPALYAELVRRLPASLAAKFDQTAFHATAAPGSGFDLLSAATAVTVDATGTYGDVQGAYQAVYTAGGVPNGWALAPQGVGVLMGAVDTTGRPIFVDSIASQGGVGSLLGAPVQVAASVYKADATGDQGEVLGFVGDWNYARWGTVEGIKVDISNEATVGGVNLFETNQFAVRAEMEIGFVVTDLTKFRKLTGSNAIA
jgi:HK97 family phage major capsid protein